MPYSYSSNEENYYGGFETREDAVAEASKELTHFWTGKNRITESPEEHWYAVDWLEYVSETEEYSLECAQGWDRSTEDQREELEAEVRMVMRRWCEKHDLLPRFYHVEDIVEHKIDE